MLDLVDALRGVGTSLHIIIMAMSPIHQLLNAFSEFNVSPVNFIITLLQDETYKSHDATRDIVESIPKLIEVFLEQASTWYMAVKAILHISMEKYTTELVALTHSGAGFHFVVTKTTETRLDGAQLLVMAKKMETLAPSLWILLDNLLSADSAIKYQRQWKHKKATKKQHSKGYKHEDEDIAMQDVWIQSKRVEAISSVEEWDKKLFSIVIKVLYFCYRQLNLTMILFLCWHLIEEAGMHEHPNEQHKSLLQCLSNSCWHLHSLLWYT